MKRKAKDPTKLHEWSACNFEGTIAGLIENLQDIVKQHPNATIEYELDYGSCFYEGDHPEAKFIIRSK